MTDEIFLTGESSDSLRTSDSESGRPDSGGGKGSGSSTESLHLGKEYRRVGGGIRKGEFQLIFLAFNHFTGKSESRNQRLARLSYDLQVQVDN